MATCRQRATDVKATHKGSDTFLYAHEHGPCEHSAVIAELQGAVARQPLRERLWQQLMLALYRAGRQGEALAAYRDARAILDEQLGVEPGPALGRLQAQILAHDTRRWTGRPRR